MKLNLKKIDWKLLVISLVIVYAVAFAGSVFTSAQTNTSWYDSIRPEITPPNYVFPIVWNILFFLIAISLYLAWKGAKKKSDKKEIAWVFGINLFLNLSWSIIFFGLQMTRIAFFELLLLWLSIVAMIYATHKIKPLASYLLIPYWAWVSFAGYLNYLIAFG